MDFLQAHIQAYLSAGFWRVHGTQMGIFLLVVAYFFPRITMLSFAAMPFNLLSWVGWLFAPSITVVVLSSRGYWKTNPELCVLAGIAKIEASEKDLDLERDFVDKCFKALSNNWDDIKELLSRPAKIFPLVAGILVIALTVMDVLLGIPTSNAITVTVVGIFISGFVLCFSRQKQKFW